MIQGEESLAAICKKVLNGTNHFEVLGLTTSAGGNAIKSAYRSRMRYLHPDKYSGEEGIDKSILSLAIERVRNAYDLLKDEDQRRAYAMKLYLQTIPADRKAEMAIRLEEVRNVCSIDKVTTDLERHDGNDIELHGEKPYYRYVYNTDCSACKGTGTVVYSECYPCPQCKGKGTVKDSSCLLCYGRGYLGWCTCRVCSGRGRVKHVRTLSQNDIAKLGKFKEDCVIIEGGGEGGHLGGKPGKLVIYTGGSK